RGNPARLAPLCPVAPVWYNLLVPFGRPTDRTRARMTATVARVSYVKRFKMEMDLRDVPAPATLPAGYEGVPWSARLLDAHPAVPYLSFKQESDAAVFPSFGDRLGCTCLMSEMSRKPGFLPAATWLLDGPDGHVGTVQGLRDRDVGAIQNLGVVPG